MPIFDMMIDQMNVIPKTLPKFLWHFAKKFKLNLLGLCFVALVWASNISLTPYAMKLIIDGVSNTKDQEALFHAVLFPSLFYLFLSVIIGVTFRFYDYLAIKTFPDLKVNIITASFDFVQKHSYSYFQHHFAGSLSNKISDMARSASTIINHAIEQFFARLLAMIIGSIAMFLVHPYFACILIFWCVFMLTTAIFLSKKAKKNAEIFSEAKSHAAGKIVDSIGNILNVKTFARENIATNLLKNCRMGINP